MALSKAEKTIFLSAVGMGLMSGHRLDQALNMAMAALDLVRAGVRTDPVMESAVNPEALDLLRELCRES